MFKLGKICVAAAAVLAFGPAGAFGATAPTGAPYRIAAIISTTGRYAALGEPMKNSLQLAEHDINAAGGINGRPLAIEIVDDEGKPDVAVQLATQAVGRGAVGLIAGVSNAASAAVTRVAMESKIPQIFMTPASELWDTPRGVAKYVFETAPSNPTEAPALLKFAQTNLHAKRVALIRDENSYGQEGEKILNQLAKGYGVEVVSSQSYPGAGTDFTAQVLATKNANPDTIFVWGAATAPPLVVRGIRQLGVKANVIGPTGILSDLFLRVAGHDGEGVYSDTQINYTHPNPLQRRFLNAYHDRFHQRPANFAAFSYDAAQLFAYALRNSGGKTDGDSLVNALETMKPLSLITGTFHFTPKDHNGLTASDIHMAVDKNQIWFNL